MPTSPTPTQSSTPTPSRTSSRTPVTTLLAFAAVMAAAPVALADLPPKETTTAQWTALRAEHYQLDKKRLGASGYDPVAYFPEGDPKRKGGTATKGNKKITFTYNGVEYRFSSAKNRELFKANPVKYEPAYGGWCAYAIAQESYTEPNPKRFLVQNGRLMLFYDGIFGDTYKDWHEEGPQKLEPLANAFWTAETGERPPSDAAEGEIASLAP